MKRMYGDESYFNVLRAEFEKNDIELKYDEYHQYFDDLRRSQYDDDYEFIDDVRPNEYEGRGFTSRSLNDPITKRLNKFSKLSEYTRPHFKPTEKTVSSSTASSTTIFSSTSPCSTLTSISTATPTDTSIPSLTTPSESVTTITSTEEASTQPVVFSKPSNITAKIVNDDSTANNTTTEANNATKASPSVTVAQIVREQNFSINEIPGQIDRIDENLEESAEVISEDTRIVEENTTSIPTNLTKELPIDQEKEEEAEEEDAVGASKTSQDHEEMVAASNQQEEFRPRPENRPSSSSTEAGTGEQLYQDAASEEQPVLKLRGVNACPVKEEVVAPFWANNTRGELLALLNLYPFEQYVHWEKCTHENKQMHCRDGCRCEQQYRLHRLLAYDPNNECRGIFSDWFKFPSCCICRCYDLPIEFRVASRSPRTSHKRRIKVQPPMRDRYA
ncbi:protein spaetzle 4 isoform X2 [Pseudomyrmex gracilis]|nr:protein spaetzle 4 isoform X2 [Pseudomyrmex gracilis]